MTWLFIEPMDAWFFRDGKPFSAGEGHMANGLFPPSPISVQGALRSLFLAHSPADWRAYGQQADVPEVKKITAVIGRPAPPDEQTGWAPSLGQFAMLGPFLAKRAGNRIVQYTPLPADLVSDGDPRSPLTALQPAQHARLHAAWPAAEHTLLWPRDESRARSPDGDLWLAADQVEAYLKDQPVEATPASALFSLEPRFGTAVDPITGAVRESMLYQAEFVRPAADVGLLVKLTGSLGMPAQQGIMAFGGESRGARYTVLDESDVQIPQGRSAHKRIKLVLQTPAYFCNGWQPARQNWLPFFGRSVTLIAVALGRPQSIGGWDLAKRWPKLMHTYVPAGSTFFFQAETPISPPARPFTEAPIHEPFLPDLGFGQFVVGHWDWLQPIQ